MRNMDRIHMTCRGLLEALPDGLVLATAAGHILFANTLAARLFGYPAEELPGAEVDLLLPPGAAGAVACGRSKDGREFAVEVSVKTVETGEGMLIARTIRDISARQQAERALRDENQHLAQTLQAKERSIAKMNHDLRTPLNAVIGFTGTLLMRLPGPLTPEQQSQLEWVQTSGRQLLALIQAGSAA